MLRFNLDTIRMQDLDRKFQYILCYGSTKEQELVTNIPKNFNTSYVTVQHALTIIRTYIFIISIHLMLRFNLFKIVKIYNVRSNFNTSYVTVQPPTQAKFPPGNEFQYILCYGSTGNLI